MQKIEQLISKDEWIIDGVSLEVQDAADCVVFLDCRRLTSYQRTFRRNLPYLFKSRPGLPDNCPEYRILPKLISIIWNFPGKVRPRILAKMNQQNGQENYHLNTKQDVFDFIGIIEEGQSNIASVVTGARPVAPPPLSVDKK